MKLRLKMLLLTGLTSFLILAAVMVLALICFSSFFSQIRAEGHRYTVNDIQTRSKNNLLRLRDVLLSSYSRTSTFFLSTTIEPADFSRVMKTRLEYAYGINAAIVSIYDLRTPRIFSDTCGYELKRDGVIAEKNDFPQLFQSRELITLMENADAGTTDFIFTDMQECWIVNCKPALNGSRAGNLFAVRMDNSYLQKLVIGMNAGYFLMLGDKRIAESYDLLSSNVAENIRRELRKIMVKLDMGGSDQIVLEQLADTQNGKEWFATGICIRYAPDKPAVKLIRLYEYDSVMPLLPRLIHKQMQTLIFSVTLFMIVGLFLLILPLFLVSKQISAPITHAVDFANAVASGDFAPRPQKTCGILEIDQLLKSLDHLRDRLNAMIVKLKRSHIREQDARKDAERMNRLKSDFLSVIYREYREPLNTLAGFSALLKNKLDRKETIDTGLLEPIVRALYANLRVMSRMSEILRELSILNIPEENSPEYESADIFQMFHELNKSLREYAARAGISLDFRYSSDLPGRLILDKQKTGRMLTMLAESLISCMNRGETLICSCAMQDNRPALCCSGTGGNPLPLEYMLYHSAVRPLRDFQTATGIIRLSIIKYMAAVVDASFDVVNDENGFAVTITLPAAATQAASGIAGHIEHSKSIPDRSDSGSTIFNTLSPVSGNEAESLCVVVAEDDESNRLLFELMLKDSHFNVSSVSDTKGIRDTLTQSMPDILLLDLHMQGLDPNQFLSEIRRMPCGQNLFIIVLTAFLADGERNRLISAGADVCLLKPLDMEDLADAVRLFMKKQH